MRIGLKRALVDRHRQVQQAQHAEGGIGAGVGERAVDRRLHLRRGAAVVDGDLVAGNGHRSVDGEVLAADDIDRRHMPIGAAGKLADLRARHRFAAGDDLVGQHLQVFPAHLGAHLLHALSADVAGGDLRAQIAGHGLVRAHVLRDEGHHVAVEFAASVELEHRDAQAFLEIVAAFGGGAAPADVDMVAAGDHVAHQRVAVEHRQRDGDVVVVAAARPWVVADQHVAGFDAGRRNRRQHAAQHVAQGPAQAGRAVGGLRQEARAWSIAATRAWRSPPTASAILRSVRRCSMRWRRPMKPSAAPPRARSAPWSSPRRPT